MNNKGCPAALEREREVQPGFRAGAGGAARCVGRPAPGGTGAALSKQGPSTGVAHSVGAAERGQRQHDELDGRPDGY